MSKYISFFSLLLVLSISASFSAKAQVEVSVPDTSGNISDTLMIPVQVSEVTGEEVFSYEFTLTYDSDIVKMIGIEASETISDGITIESDTSAKGEIAIAASSTSTLEGSGELILLTTVIKNKGETNLHLQSFQFNEGDPSANVSNGSVSVVQSAIPQNLTASVDTGSVELSWDPVETADLAGYLIYRGFGNENLTKLDSVSKNKHVYIDSTIKKERQVTYAVSSIDTSNNESALSNKKQVTTIPTPIEFALSIDSVKTFPGLTENIPLRIQIPQDTAIHSFEIDIALDLSRVSFDSIRTDSSLVGNQENWQLEYNSNSTSISIAASGASMIDDSGNLLELVVSVPDSLQNEELPVSFSNIILNEGSYTIHKNNGRIAVSDILYGDVSLNGEVRALDAGMILDHLINNLDLNERQFRNGDVTQDSTLTTLDASIILKFLVGKVPKLPYSPTIQTSGSLDLASRTVEPVDTVHVPLSIKKAKQLLGMYAQLTYDKSKLQFKKFKSSPDFQDARIKWSEEQNTLRMAGASAEEFKGTGTFGNLVFELNSSFNSGKARIYIQEYQLNESTTQDNTISAVVEIVETSTDDQHSIPESFNLYNPYPSPFNPQTTVKYDLPKTTDVSIIVYNILGQQVRTLLDKQQSAGTHTVRFKAQNLPSGQYLIRMLTKEYVDEQSVMLLK